MINLPTIRYLTASGNKNGAMQPRAFSAFWISVLVEIAVP
jgi:hypothetical protein